MDLIPFRSQCRHIMYYKLTRLIILVNQMLVKEAMINLTDKILCISYKKILKKLKVTYTFDNFPFKALQGHYMYECIFTYYRVIDDDVFLCFDLDNCYLINNTSSISPTITFTDIIEARNDIVTEIVDDVKSRLETEKEVLFDNGTYDIKFDIDIMIDIILKRLSDENINILVNRKSITEYTIFRLDKIIN